MSAVELGATLYVPAINGAARAMAYGSIPDLRSMVVCLEDAIRDDQVPQAVEGLSSLLMELAGKPSDLMIYVRPRNLRMLTQLLQMPNIDRVTGFVLPKVTTQTLPVRSEEHTSELQSLMRISYACFCLKKTNK